jgi:hypothetical protein
VHLHQQELRGVVGQPLVGRLVRRRIKQAGVDEALAALGGGADQSLAHRALSVGDELWLDQGFQHVASRYQAD